jgi:hypothetical protein
VQRAQGGGMGGVRDAGAGASAAASGGCMRGVVWQGCPGRRPRPPAGARLLALTCLLMASGWYSVMSSPDTSSQMRMP